MANLPPPEYVRFKVTGITPLLMARYSKVDDEPGVGIALKSRRASKEEEAESLAYRLPTGQLYVDAVALRQSLVQGGKGRKLQGTRMGANTIISSTLFNTEQYCPLVHPETGEVISEYEIDSRRVVNKAAGAVVAHRPKIDQWSTVVEFEYESEFLATDVIETIFAIAGRKVGIGAYRPEKSGPFGRYSVELLDVA